MILQIKNTIVERGMLSRGESVLVGVSGGADSVCLLYVLNNLKDELDITLSVAHLNHGLRGEDADADERFVAELCAKLGIKFYNKKVDLSSDNDTVESAGRQARYKFFAELKRKHKFDKIATAHNMDDQAETLLMRIMRGTGISGLGGTQYVRDDGVIRPLLDVSRKEIEEYLRANNIEYRTDSTNSDTGFTRNRIRTELLPYLEASFNPNVKEALCRLVATAGEDGAFLENYAKRLYSRLKNPLPQSEPICLHIPSILMVEKPILSRLIRIAAEQASLHHSRAEKSANNSPRGTTFCEFPTCSQLENKHINDILSLARAGKSGSSLDLTHDLRVAVNYDWLTFSKQSEVQMFGEFYLEIEPIGVYEIKKYGVRITARQIDYADYVQQKYDTFVDEEKLAGRKLHLRRRKDGDKMAVFADGRTKKINDIFTDMKIARHHRDRQLILATDNEIVAILGVRVSEKYRANGETKEGILIRYESLQNPDN